MGRLFGTDGVRGRANADLTPELALAVAMASAHTLAELDHSHRPVAIVGRDPRASGEMLAAAVSAGLASAGADVLDAGVLPTPAVAYLVAATGADLGVVLSASHNPMPDNGIKLFAAGGHKLPDDVEMRIEAMLDAGPGAGSGTGASAGGAGSGTDGSGSGMDGGGAGAGAATVGRGNGSGGRRGAGLAWRRPIGPGVGRIRSLDDAVGSYVTHLTGSTPHRLDGLRIVVDCANGAASAAAPAAYRAAGADVVAINAEPDGLNINDGCGSNHPDALREAVLAHRADLGIAHDGDADRCVAVDATGADVDGDQIMAILALRMKEAGTLAEDTLVATVMSNLGLRLAMREHGIAMVEAAVGDRYVLEELRNRKLALGGEQSGHIVMPAYSTTGDGLLTALHLMATVAATGRPLAELASVVTRLPQVLLNVPVADRAAGASDPRVRSAVAETEAALGDTGRVLLRPSGTEQLVRVMVEAASVERAREAAERIAREVHAASPAN